MKLFSILQIISVVFLMLISTTLKAQTTIGEFEYWYLNTYQENGTTACVVETPVYDNNNDDILYELSIVLDRDSRYYLVLNDFNDLKTVKSDGIIIEFTSDAYRIVGDSDTGVFGTYVNNDIIYSMATNPAFKLFWPRVNTRIVFDTSGMSLALEAQLRCTQLYNN